MSAQRTKFPKNPVPARRVHQGTTIVGKNGLPVDALATIEPGSILVSGGTTISYAAPTVTFDAGVDLSALVSFSSKTAQHTGVLIFTDQNNNSYFIDPDSIDNTAKTVDIYTTADLSSTPSTLSTGGGWKASEAELVNRLQTTTTAVVDNIEFRDVEVKVDLDGSTVNIKDDDGDQLEIEQDGSINVNIVKTNPAGETVTTYNEPVALIPTSTPTTIVTYTAPIGKSTYLQKVDVSGENIAEYEVRVNGTVISKKRTYFPNYDTNFNFLSGPGGNGRDLTAGDVVTVVVTHFRSSAAKFNSTIQSLEI